MKPWQHAITAAVSFALGIGLGFAVGESAETIKGPVEAKVIRVIDGDTFEAELSLWVDLTKRTSVRVRGVDTPEIKGNCKAERDGAAAAKLRVSELLDGRIVSLTVIAPDKYAGRVDATVTLPDGQDLAKLLIAEKLARPYAGGKRRSWC